MKYPTTSKTLIDKLKDGDSVTWNEFYNRYSSIIISVGVSKGLNKPECDDLVQEVMLVFFKTSQTFKFDPNIAKFRTFMGKIIYRKTIDIFRKRLNLNSPEKVLEDKDNETPDVIVDKEFMEQWRKFILEQAKENLRNRVNIKTYQAFELFAEQNRDIKKVSELLEMSTNQIYVAKNRCLKTLKKIIQELHEADPEVELIQK